MPSQPARKTTLRPAVAFVLATAVTAAAVLVTACGTVKSPTEPGTPAPGPGTPALTFSQIQTQILTPNCAKSGCHSRAVASGGMVLEAGASFGQIVGHPAAENPALARIQPGDPERSYLFKKIRGDADISGSRMPKDGPPYLAQAQIDGIAAWIRAGAPNN
jgi:hypothetical protein